MSHSTIFRSTMSRTARQTISNKQTKHSCQICENRFQLLLNQEHQCKRCLRAICDKCIATRSKIYYFQSPPALHKICSFCKKEEDLFTSLIHDHKLTFRLSSKLSEEWIKKQNRERLSFEHMINEYEQMKCQTNSNIITYKSQCRKLHDSFHRHSNYSVRQFIGRLTQEIRPELVFDSVNNVMVAVYAYLSQMPYTAELINVVMFLLCFCSEGQCYFILSRFIEKTFPQYQRLESTRDCVHELKLLVDMYSVLVRKPDRNELKLMTSYFEHIFLSFVKSFTINSTKVAVSFYLIDEMLTSNSYIYLYKGIAAIGFICREVLSAQLELNSVLRFIVNQGTLDKLKNIMIFFQRSNAKFQMVHQFFDSPEHRKLFEKYKLLESIHQKGEEKCKQLEKRYSELSTQHEQLLLKYGHSSTKLLSLQQELLSLADKIITLDDYEQLSLENASLLKHNQKQTEELRCLSLKYQELNKVYTLEESTRQMYIRMQADYQQEIVEIKTKNQIYQIQKLANQIQFQTSHIEEQFMIKNERIGGLEKENIELKRELEFYRQNRGYSRNLLAGLGAGGIGIGGGIGAGGELEAHREDLLGTSLMSNIYGKNERKMSFETEFNLSHIYINPKQERPSLKKLMQTNLQVISTLKTDLSSASNQKNKLKSEVKSLSEQVTSQNTQLQLINEINDFINQIPEEVNYLETIETIENLKAEEINIHKSTQLENILTNFRKCQYQVRYRTIDAKLKENRIKENIAHPLSSNSTSHDREEDVSDELAWLGNTNAITELNRKVLKKQESCLLM